MDPSGVLDDCGGSCADIPSLTTDVGPTNPATVPGRVDLVLGAVVFTIVESRHNGRVPPLVYVPQCVGTGNRKWRDQK